jgi:hypothetical protein
MNIIFLIIFFIILFLSSSKLFEDSKKTIVFSLTCHENIDCIIDLINNIYKCFEDFNIYILISTNENINNQLIKLKLNKNIIVVSVRDNNHNIWGNIDLFYQHIKNINYLKNNNINYDYFWFIASNEYFIKKVNLKFLQTNIIKNYQKKELCTEEVNIFYNNFLLNNHEWDWFNKMKLDTYTINILKENNIILYSGRHESLVLPNNLALEIADIYGKLQIQEKSVYKDYVMEEIFVFSYLKSKYNLDKINTFCSLNSTNIDENVYNEALLNNLIVSIKPIKRDYNDELRTKIRNSIYINNNKKLEIIIFRKLNRFINTQKILLKNILFVMGY